MSEREASEREDLRSVIFLEGFLLVFGAVGIACPVEGYLRIFFWSLLAVAALGFVQAMLRLHRMPAASREFGSGGGEAEPWRQRFIDLWDRLWFRARRARARRR